jgi:uncharacterized protein (DUF1330 family)
MSDKPVLIVSLWLRGEDVEAFESFESKIAQIQAKHGGRIDQAIRVHNPDGDPTLPFEVHVVSFERAEGLAAYRADPQFQELRGLAERILLKTVVLQGRDVGPY